MGFCRASIKSAVYSATLEPLQSHNYCSNIVKQVWKLRHQRLNFENARVGAQKKKKKKKERTVTVLTFGF